MIRLVEVMEHHEIPWCMIGGLAVNHWADEPMATADVDLVIATECLDDAVHALEKVGFKSKSYPWSINLRGNSKVTVQISTGAEYEGFPSRAVPADVHGILMRVASLQDTLNGKIQEWRDPERRASKRLKDLVDILRLLEIHPDLKDHIPEDVRVKIQ